MFRYWKSACYMAWFVFVGFEVGIGCDHYFSKKPLCPYSDHDYGAWYWYIIVGVLGAFIIVWGIIFMKLFQSKPGIEMIPYLTAFNIVSMGTISTVLAVALNWGGVCIDVLG